MAILDDKLDFVNIIKYPKYILIQYNTYLTISNKDWFL
jgi:hypothetical protein